MREVLFKAKRKDNGEWVEGYVVAYPSGKVEIHKISKELPDILLKCEIAPSTLCQYIGLTDKNDKKIWENDIVELPDEEGYFTCKWEEDAARFVMNGDGLTVNFDNYWSYQTEVAGNIFDNPELLGVE